MIQKEPETIDSHCNKDVHIYTHTHTHGGGGRVMFLALFQNAVSKNKITQWLIGNEA